MRRAAFGGLLGLLSLTALGLSPRGAAADSVGGARSAKLVERRHLVSIALEHGHARMVFRRTVHNGGARHDQALFWLHTPPGSVAVGLRTLGTLGGKPFWFTAELMEAEAAAARYHELTGVGGFYPKDPALLSWRDDGLLALQVFPVAPGTEKTVEYTLEMPTRYHGGRDHLALPRLGTAALAPVATVVTPDAREGIFAGDSPLAAGATVALDPEEGVDLSISRAGARQIGGALAVVPFARGRVLLRQRLEAAPRLGEVPAGARVVVVLDASRSLPAGDAAAQVAAARAYLAHFPDAEAEILTFDRRVSAIHGGFVPVPKALATLDHLTIARRNGSHVDAALARAAALFRGLPGKVARRVVVFTDGLTRAALDASAMRGQLARAGALVHVGVIEGSSPALDRDDHHPWSPAVRATGGLVWRARASGEPGHAAEMRRVYEELARPVRIDHLAVTLPGLDGAPFSYPARLAEGEGFSDLRVVDRPVGWIRAAGEVWAKKVSATLVPDADEGRRSAALVFGTDLRSELSEPEMMTLAVLGHAVSPVTSLLAVEPGVRPSTEGLADDEIGESFSGGTVGFTVSGSLPGMAVSAPDLAALLQGLLAPGWAACGGAGKRATLGVETTRDEVVDVTDVRVPSGDPALARCLEEAAWAVELPGDFAAYPHRLVKVTL